MGVGGQRHVPAALPPGKRSGTHCTGGWVGPRAGLDGCGKSRHHRDSIPRPSSPQRVAKLNYPGPQGLYGTAKNSWDPAARNLLKVTLLAPIILGWLQDFWKIWSLLN